MQKSLLYENINKFKHKKFKMPELNEDNHKLYWEVACRLGIMSDPRYPRVCEVHRILREHEFQHFADQYYMPQGARQSLTYRTNRIEENLQTICDTFRRTGVSDWVWMVREAGSYNTLGYVVATTSTEANHLAELMYTGIAEGKIYVGERPYLPTWQGENDIFVMKMNERLLRITEQSREAKKRIEELQKKLHYFEVLSDHLILNMSAFEK